MLMLACFTRGSSFARRRAERKIVERQAAAYDEYDMLAHSAREIRGAMREYVRARVTRVARRYAIQPPIIFTFHTTTPTHPPILPPSPPPPSSIDPAARCHAAYDVDTPRYADAA